MSGRVSRPPSYSSFCYRDEFSLEQNITDFIDHLRPYKNYDDYRSFISCSSRTWAVFVNDYASLFGKINRSSMSFCPTFSALCGVGEGLAETGNPRADKLDLVFFETFRLLAKRPYASSPVLTPGPVLVSPLVVLVLATPLVTFPPVLSVPCSFSVEVSPPSWCPSWSFDDAPFGCGWSQCRKRLCVAPCAGNAGALVPAPVRVSPPAVLPVRAMSFACSPVPAPLSFCAPVVPTTPVPCYPPVAPLAVCVPSCHACIVPPWYSFVPLCPACSCGPGPIFLCCCGPLVPLCPLFILSGNGPGPPLPLCGPCNTLDPPGCVFVWPVCAWLFLWLLFSLPLGPRALVLALQLLLIGWFVPIGTSLCLWVRRNLFYPFRGVPSLNLCFLDTRNWVSLKPSMDCLWSLADEWCLLLLGGKNLFCLFFGYPLLCLSFGYS